jgi:hypothetical protein
LETFVSFRYFGWMASFPDGMPRILYARCERPLVYEVDRLRRIVRDNGIEFSVFDSVAFACDGPPEAAEVARRYFRAVRQIGGGSLHIAHVSKAEGADNKPFGSTFWHNGARSTWFDEVTRFRRTDVADSPDLAGQLTVRQRMAALLRKGAMAPAAIAEEMEAKADTIERTARRYKEQFIVIPGGRIGLLEKGLF